MAVAGLFSSVMGSVRGICWLDGDKSLISVPARNIWVRRRIISPSGDYTFVFCEIEVQEKEISIGEEEIEVAIQEAEIRLPEEEVLLEDKVGRLEGQELVFVFSFLGEKVG